MLPPVGEDFLELRTLGTNEVIYLKVDTIYIMCAGDTISFLFLKGVGN
jgi:hypothetical protein